MAGATSLNVAGGMSGFAAVLAPELALAGFEAQGMAIEEALGSLVGSAFRPDGLLDELGQRWEITRNYFRLYACCNPIHPALDCLADLIAALQPLAEDVARVEVSTYRFASLMRNAEPTNYFASKYSLPHAAAAMIVNGHAGHSSLNDAALRDPAIAALRRRVEIREDPAMTAVAPRLRPARVTMILKDGRSATGLATVIAAISRSPLPKKIFAPSFASLPAPSSRKPECPRSSTPSTTASVGKAQASSQRSCSVRARSPEDRRLDRRGAFSTLPTTSCASRPR